MNPQVAHELILPAAFQLLDQSLDTPQSRAMLLAIALQESDFQHRQQLIGHHRHWWESIKGPAAGFWQFERIGIRGVLEHRSTGPLVKRILGVMGYPEDVNTLHRAIVHNDILAAIFARKALWQLPEALPRGPNNHTEAWHQYLRAWRPGKPSPERWESRYRQAWEIVNRRNP
jgi:hypothetical protein